ncbi:DNA polymerase III subunit delta' [Paenibacillus chitinolyticus]|uniref:DNA polymerase III subunit delta' n=1 Tax=Paenibacillus chitinolyticus TaxID=79263 RepID=UPI00295F24DE|nr:DNA polymerase III subunit delta' [Paenibacillus chitinolyticus]
MSFQTIPGQETAKRILQSGLRQDRISHAYIFSGPVGTGRKQTARMLAKAIYCTHLKDDACGECLECRKVEHGNHPDLYQIEPDGASIKIDQIRELQKQFAYRSAGSGTKIYILNQAEKMTVQAANSLLKFLEEPNSKVVAVLVTENGHALLPTIQSRSQWISFTPMPRTEMARVLLEEGHPAALVQPAIHLTAGIQAAKEMIQTNGFAEIRSTMIQLLRETLTRYPSSFVTLQQKWIKAGLADHTALLFDLMILWLKDMVSLRIGRKENFVYIDQMDWMGPLSFKRETGEWVRLLARAVELQKRLRFNANPQLVVEKMLVDIQGV